MTTAHRATWFTARGHEEQGGARVFAPSKKRSKLDDPGMLTMKTRWKTKEEEEMEKLLNGAESEGEREAAGKMTMRMKLLEKERAHFRKKKMERQIMGAEEKEEEEEDRGGNKRLRIEAGTTTSAFQANPEDADDDDSENEGDNSDGDDSDDGNSDDADSRAREKNETRAGVRASEGARARPRAAPRSTERRARPRGTAAPNAGGVSTREAPSDVRGQIIIVGFPQRA